jgi:hypothetical protein
MAISHLMLLAGEQHLTAARLAAAALRLPNRAGLPVAPPPSPLRPGSLTCPDVPVEAGSKDRACDSVGGDIHVHAQVNGGAWSGWSWASTSTKQCQT